MFSKEYLGNTTDKVLNYLDRFKKPEFNYLIELSTDGGKAMDKSKLGSNEL